MSTGSESALPPRGPCTGTGWGGGDLGFLHERVFFLGYAGDITQVYVFYSHIFPLSLNLYSRPGGCRQLQRQPRWASSVQPRGTVCSQAPLVSPEPGLRPFTGCRSRCAGAQCPDIPHRALIQHAMPRYTTQFCNIPCHRITECIPTWKRSVRIIKSNSWQLG